MKFSLYIGWSFGIIGYSLCRHQIVENSPLMPSIRIWETSNSSKLICYISERAYQVVKANTAKATTH